MSGKMAENNDIFTHGMSTCNKSGKEYPNILFNKIGCNTTPKSTSVNKLAIDKDIGEYPNSNKI